MVHEKIYYIFILYTMQKINIIVGRFQPLTRGHQKCIQSIYKETGRPVMVCMIGVPDDKVDQRHPFKTSTLLPLYEDLFGDMKEVAGFRVVKNANIIQIGSDLYNEGYEVSGWVCGTDRVASYQKMVDKYHDKAMLSDDFRLLEIKRTDDDISATKLREALLKGDEKGFYRGSPSISLSKYLRVDYYGILKNEIDKIYGS